MDIFLTQKEKMIIIMISKNKILFGVTVATVIQNDQLAQTDYHYRSKYLQVRSSFSASLTWLQN